MSWAKITLSNILIFILLLCFGELGFRVAWTVKNCIQQECTFSRLSNLAFLGESPFSKFMGITRFDEQLGYVPAEGFSAIISASGWNKKPLTINEHGFRANSREITRSNSSILAVGDSFTFGDQVSDDETWASCLQQLTSRRVDNGGVFGYGTAQALLRAQKFIEKFEYSTVILSVTVGHDFQRDRKSYRSGFAKPYLKKSSGGIEWASVSDPNVKGTKYNPSTSIISHISRYSLLYDYFSKRINFLPIGLNDQLTLIGEDAAEISEIITWTITQLNSLPVERKVLLLQYSSDIESDRVQGERNTLLRELPLYQSLEVVDTYQHLLTMDATKLWNGHHTPYGNKLVCEILYDTALKVRE